MTIYATYALEWTPDITAGLSSAFVDITSDVVEIRWRRGRDYASQLVGKFVSLQASVILDNTDGSYSSYVTVNMRPGRRVRLKATDGTGTVTLWTGFLQRVNAIPNLKDLNVAEMTVIGPLGFIGDRQVDAAIQSSVTTGAGITAILDAAGWPSSVSTTVLADSPVGYWRLGESSGNAIDSSGNGNDGTCTGVSYSSTGIIAGDADTAFAFDGANDDVDMASPSELDDIFDGGGSIEAWINADSDGENDAGAIAAKYATTGWYFYVGDESGGAMDLIFVCTFSGVDGQWETTAREISTSTTHHVVLTYDSDATTNDPIIYVDGLVVGLTELGTPTGTRDSDATRNLVVGNLTSLNNTFHGTLDEIALYSTVLTPAQVRTHYAAGAEQWRTIDDGQTTMTRWWTEPKPTLSALREVEDTELGFVWESREGYVGFDDRNGRLDATHQTSQATFSDAVAAALPFTEILQEDSLPFVFNDAAFPVQLYTVGSLAVMWTLSESGANSPLIVSTESATFWATFPTLASATNAMGVDSWTTPVATTDYTANSQSDGGGSNETANISVAVVKYATRMKITLTNDGGTDAYITLLQARGTPFTADDPVIVRVDDADSIETYGKHPYPLTPRFIPDTTEAGSVANLIIAATKEAFALPRISMLANLDAAMLSEALRRDISDRITIVADSPRTRLGLAHDVFIESEEHFINRHRIHTFSYQTSAASTFSDFWVWGFAKWDTTSKWAG